MGTIMIFLRMRRPGADGARREPARMGRRRASRRRVDVGRDVRRRDRAVRVVLDAMLAAQERARDLAINIVVEAALRRRRRRRWLLPRGGASSRRRCQGEDGSKGVPTGRSYTSVAAARVLLKVGRASNPSYRASWPRYRKCEPAGLRGAMATKDAPDGSAAIPPGFRTAAPASTPAREEAHYTQH